jgi:hypothetical protein
MIRALDVVLVRVAFIRQLYGRTMSAEDKMDIWPVGSRDPVQRDGNVPDERRNIQRMVAIVFYDVCPDVVQPPPRYNPIPFVDT